MSARTIKKLLREGDLIAEVRVTLIPDDGAWGPYISKDDMLKLSRVRRALKARDIEAAKREGNVFEVTPA